jgi:hypothetical protein
MGFLPVQFQVNRNSPFPREREGREEEVVCPVCVGRECSVLGCRYDTWFGSSVGGRVKGREGPCVVGGQEENGEVLLREPQGNQLPAGAACSCKGHP